MNWLSFLNIRHALPLVTAAFAGVAFYVLRSRKHPNRDVETTKVRDSRASQNGLGDTGRNATAAPGSNEMDVQQAKAIVESLTCARSLNNIETLTRTLNTVSNAAAFTNNLTVMRDAGILTAVIDHLKHVCFFHTPLTDDENNYALAVVRCINNMSLNETNQEYLKVCCSDLIGIVTNPLYDESLRLEAVNALTNLTVITNKHVNHRELIETLLNNATNQGNEQLCLQSLRLLVNLIYDNDDNILLICQSLKIPFNYPDDKSVNKRDIFCRWLIILKALFGYLCRNQQAIDSDIFYTAVTFLNDSFSSVYKTLHEDPDADIRNKCADMLYLYTNFSSTTTQLKK